MHQSRSSPAELELTQRGAARLAAEIAAGNVTAVEVVEVHLARIAAINPALNAIIMPRYDQARREAALADEAQRRGEPLGPLHGVPITIKECFHLAGFDSTIGIDQFVGQPLAQDGILVRNLKAAGAIIVGKTNVPQFMLLHETDNPVFGRSNNPWRLERSCGGSSGGEAAIVAAGGSALGLASDLGGSIRQPAHSCGIHGLMPTRGRLSTAGSRNNFHGMEAIGVQAGPLARHVEDLELALRVLQTGVDHRGQPLPAMPLRLSAEVELNKLRIGFWTDDGYFPTSPALRRAVNEAAAAMTALGVDVVPFAPPDVGSAMRAYYGLISAGGAADMIRALKNGRVDWRLRRLVRIGRLPPVIRWPLVFGMKMLGQKRLAELVATTGARQAEDYWQLCHFRQQYAERFLAKLNELQIDVLLFPPHALPALSHGSTMHLPPAGSYCYLANMLGIPAGVVAATRVRAGEETDRPITGDLVERAARGVELGSAGLPVGVQVAGRPWREDQVLAVMRALETHFRTQPDYPDWPPM